MMNLSKKIIDFEGIDEEWYLKVEDVKKFIQELKEGFIATDEMTESLFMKLQVQIDNHAGEDLV